MAEAAALILQAADGVAALEAAVAVHAADVRAVRDDTGEWRAGLSVVVQIAPDLGPVDLAALRAWVAQTARAHGPHLRVNAMVLRGAGSDAALLDWLTRSPVVTGRLVGVSGLA